MNGTLDPQRVEEAVNRICELGCARVREILAALARGSPVAEMAGLSETERQAVRAELQAIMAVYDRGQ
ncbi:MAG: hypothetical protein K6T56_12140 [Burkholderiales bacterium]|jgi:hypothetical protein|nr:hypothetical protein [Burkholderiales bacterium]